jgi:hypothetical protein
MIHRNLSTALIAAGAYIAGALALKAAERAGFMTHDVAVRAIEVFNGLALAIYGNFLPKSIGTFRNAMAAMRMQAVLRVSGWAFTLGGLGYAAASLAPVPDAVGLAVLSAATAYVMGYSAWAFMECSEKPEQTT